MAAEQFWQQWDHGNFWDNWPEQEVAPSAQRDFRGLTEARAKAHLSGQFDEDQLAEMDQLFAQREQTLGLHGTQGKVREPSTAQQIRGNIATIGDRVFTRNPQTGESVLLADGAQAKQDQEFAKAEHQMKMQEAQTKLLTQQEGAKIKLAQQQAGLTTTNADGTPGKPQYTPEQVRENVDKVFPQSQGMMSTPPEQTQAGQGPAQVGQYPSTNHPAMQFMPPELQQSVATFQQGTPAEREAAGNIVGGVRTYYNTKSGRYEAHPGDVARAREQAKFLEAARRQNDIILRSYMRQEEKRAENSPEAEYKKAYATDFQKSRAKGMEVEEADAHARATADSLAKTGAPAGQAPATVPPKVNHAFANSPAGEQSAPAAAPGEQPAAQQANVQMVPENQMKQGTSKLAQESAFQNDHEAEWQKNYDALPSGKKIMGLDGKVYRKP